jgi:hypothetical protein
VDLKHKQTAASQGHTADSDENSHYPYPAQTDGHGKDDDGDGHVRSDYSRDGHDKDDHGTEKVDKYYKSRYRSDKIDDYVQSIGHHVKGQFRGRKKYKDDDDKMGHSSEKSNHFKNNDAGSDQKWDKEHVKNEYDKLKGFDQDGDNHEASGRQHKDDDATAAPEQREVTSKSDDDDDSSNKADSRPPENIKEKLEQNHNDEEEDQTSTQGSSEHGHNSREDSSEKDNTEQKQGEQSKEEEHQDSDYHNQIPAPALRTWDDDFWNSHYPFEDNNSQYGFGLHDAQKSGTDEQKDKPSQPYYQYTRPQYFGDPGFEPVHEWHVSSRRRSEKPSFESSESQSELKKEEEEEGEKQGEETSRSSSDSPEEHTDPSVIENFDPTEPPTHGQDVTDKPPIPVHSTSRPKLAQLIHEIEGTKQNPLWPPPFEHGFEGTDSSVDTQRPEQTNVTSSKKAPDHVSPLLMNVYNYTSVSDYLLDLNKKDLLQKQPSGSSEQHERIEDASQNDKSPVSYVAVVIPHSSRRKHAEKSDHLVPLKPSIVDVAYPQELLPKYEEHVPSTTSAKSDGVKDNETPTFKLFTKSDISNPSQNLRHGGHVETQDPPLETHYNPLFLSSSLSLESNNASGDHVQTFPDSYLNTFFHNPETHSNTNIQPQGVRTSDNSSHHDNGELQYGSPYYGHLFQDHEAYSKPSDREEGSSSSLDLKSPSNSPDSHFQNDNIQHYFDSRYDNLFIQNPGTFPNTSPQTEVFSSVQNSESPSNYQKEDTNLYPDTHYNSFLQPTGLNTKTNDSSEESPSVLNFRHPTNPSEQTYSRIQNENINHYPEFDYSAFQNVETQLLDSTFPHNSYNNDQGYYGDKTYNLSEASSDGKEVPTTPKPLRLVVPELQPHTLPSPQTSQLHVVIPDGPQSASFFDFSSGNEQNEPKSEDAYDKHYAFLTIPSPTPYSDHSASVKNPEKWVLGDDAPSDKNLKTKEHTIHVSKTRVSGKVHSQPNANLTAV